MAICPHCATELEDGARFCGACGKPITSTAAAQAAVGPSGAPSPHEQVAPAAAAADTQPSGSKPHRSRLAPASTPQDPPGKDPATAPAKSPPPEGPARSEPVSAIAPPPPPPARKAAAPGATAPSGSARAAVLGSARRRRPASPLEELIGRTLNHRYLVEDKIGEGGFGAVFRGKQIATGREVALKILHPQNVTDQTILARFKREAEACSRLRDPHTVTTYDFDETPDGILYLAMELLRGRSLHQLQKSVGPLPPGRVLAILDQVAQSLGEAHANGIIHRDMKPENVFVETRDGQDHVKVLDFGIAKVITEDQQAPALTAIGQTLGTLEFMSPEQLRGQKLDGRSDLYALGMMAYEMLTGKLPFAKLKNAIDIINFHMKTEPPAPSRLTSTVDIPPAVDAIVLKMVAKNRDQRFADARTLRNAIARVERALARPSRRVQNYRLLGIVGATVALGTALLYLLHH